MRIAQVAPLIESVPPKNYGGTERIVSYLTEELVEQGHDVTLFASGDSVTSAKLISVVDTALRSNFRHFEQVGFHILMLERVYKLASQFDLIHFHIDLLHFSASRFIPSPHITTLHGRLDLPYLPIIFKEFNDIPLISISNNQRKPLPFANWQATVYNGIPEKTYTFNPDPDGYLAFLGRISPEKGIKQAIEIAIRSEQTLLVAAKIDKGDEEYYRHEIKPLLAHPLIEYIGEINDREKNKFLGNAKALLFPIDWPEPFGLVMIEAMACGTPVIAFNCGSVPEIMVHGEAGFIVQSVDDAVASLEKIDTISRRRCRYIYERQFSANKMTNRYLDVYQTMIDTDNPRLQIAI